MKVKLLLEVEAEAPDSLELDHVGAIAQSLSLVQYDVTETALPSGVMLRNTNFRTIEIHGISQQLVAVHLSE